MFTSQQDDWQLPEPTEEELQHVAKPSDYLCWRLKLNDESLYSLDMSVCTHVHTQSKHWSPSWRWVSAAALCVFVLSEQQDGIVSAKEEM